jgi:hypothetical protein
MATVVSMSDRLPPAAASGQWSDNDFDVLANGVAVGRIFKANATPVGTPWMWTLAFAARGSNPGARHAESREAAMAAFAKSWRRV